MPRRPRNLSEARERFIARRERREKKRRELYKTKLRKLTEQINITRYEEEHIRIPLLDRYEEMLMHWREVVKIGFFKWIINQELKRVRKIRRKIEHKLSLLDVLKACLGEGFVPIAVEWRFPKVKVYADAKIEEYLQSPEYADLVRDALGVIFADILRGKFLIEMPPEDLERLKGVLTFLKEQYFAPYKEMPCRRSQYIVKLTPLTFRFLKGYGVRFYVLRFVKVETLHNDPYIRVTKPIDIHFADMRRRKPWYEIIASMTFLGESPSLTGREDIPLTRDYDRSPRDLMKSYVAMTIGRYTSEALARRLGLREKIYEFDHCSIYVKPILGKIYKPERSIERDYRRRYPGLMLR